jgi:hypothetical protein
MTDDEELVQSAVRNAVSMNVTRNIELATAEKFLRPYNARFATTFRVTESSDAPDIRCRDDTGRTLNLEIGMTQDEPWVIQALLHRSKGEPFLKRLQAEVELVSQGKRDPTARPPELDGAIGAAVRVINKKLVNDYGACCALVVRDASIQGWSWDQELDKIRAGLNLSRQPFDKGIWIVPLWNNTIFQVA